MVVAPREQRLPSRRAERRGVEAIVFQANRCELVKIGCLARPAKSTRRRKADVVEQHDQYVRRASRWAQRHDRRKLGVRIFGVVGG